MEMITKIDCNNMQLFNKIIIRIEQELNRLSVKHKEHWEDKGVKFPLTFNYHHSDCTIEILLLTTDIDESMKAEIEAVFNKIRREVKMDLQQ